ncbi:MAG: hypothetical protein JXA44_11265 [Methanospirillaceae archaeon]|nr:hypothetical protein [Methanospirillaceae archaeon]
MVLLSSLLFWVFFWGVSPVAGDEWIITLAGPDDTLSFTETELFELINEKTGDFTIERSYHECIYRGYPLWRLLKLVDSDHELGAAYMVHLTAKDGVTVTIPYAVLYHNDDYFVAYGKDEKPLPDEIFGLSGDPVPAWPLILMGPELLDDRVTIGALDTITASEDRSYTLIIDGPEKTREFTADEITGILKEKDAIDFSYQDMEFFCLPVYSLIQEVVSPDVQIQNVVLTAIDGYQVTIPYEKIADNTGYLLAFRMNGEELPQYIPDMYGDVDLPAWPLLLVDPGFPSYEETIGQVCRIHVS